MNTYVYAELLIYKSIYTSIISIYNSICLYLYICIYIYFYNYIRSFIFLYIKKTNIYISLNLYHLFVSLTRPMNLHYRMHYLNVDFCKFSTLNLTYNMYLDPNDPPISEQQIISLINKTIKDFLDYFGIPIDTTSIVSDIHDINNNY